MNTLILQFKKLTPLRLIVFALACFALVPKVQAVVPPPDGGYAGFNTAEGQDALFKLTTGIYNTATGFRALFSNQTGSRNTANGLNALLFNTAGSSNTAIGINALYFNSASNNTAIGDSALLSNTTGTRHTAVGFGALQDCIAPPDFAGNTAVGTRALAHDTTGNFNTAIGDAALITNTIGAVNTAIGLDALAFNTEGDQNTATGGNALFSNTLGTENTATGLFALFSNTEGTNNTAMGKNALNMNIEGDFNTAVGRDALIFSTGDDNTALGHAAGVNVATASNVICIGNAGADVSNSCFIGNIYSNVQPIVGTDPDSVTITSTGRLGRGNVSSRRYKHDVKPMDKASDVLYALKPVSFRYNKEYDATQTLAFGLIAEEVAEVAPDLVGRNPQGQPESVRYEQINAMLLNEFLKEHRKVEQLEGTIASLAATVKEQAAQIQRVSAQLEVSKPAPQTVLNNH